VSRSATAGIALVATGWFATLGCGTGAPPAPSTGPLPAGVVARVGTRPIPTDRVARIAAAQRIDMKAAREAAIRDELFAEGAIARGLDRSRDVHLSINGELARRALRRLRSEARAAPPTEAELTKAAARRWLDVDRPEGFRTVHAVARTDPKKDDDAKQARARALAEKIRAAVEPIAARAAEMPLPEDAPRAGPRVGPNNDPDPLSAAFRKAVLPFLSEGIEIVVEPLPPVAADARVLVPGPDQWFDLDFAKAAAALPARGALSPLVTSQFGVHVILLLERTPAQVLTDRARAARLFDDIVNERARAAQRDLLAPRRLQVEITADAPGLLSLVAVDP